MSLKVGDLIPIGGGGYSLLSNVENFYVDSVDDQTVRLTWKDPNDVIVDGILITEWAGTQIRGKKGNYPSNEKDGVLFIDSKNRNQYQNTPLELTGLDNEDKYFFMAFPYTNKNVFTVDSANRVSATPHLYDDWTGGPGARDLISGTRKTGFFGEVPASELITGDALALEVGISNGASQNSTAGWLKFSYKGKILFVAKRPLRHSISWNMINTAKCVYGDSGDKTVTIGGLTYKVRLMRALEPTHDPKTTASADSGVVNHYSEWNRLMCQIHEQAIEGSWDYPDNIENDIGILEHSLGSGSQGMYNNANIGVGSGNGRRTWCQERYSIYLHGLHRGYSGVSHSSSSSSSEFSNTANGWRPVLELVEED